MFRKRGSGEFGTVMKAKKTYIVEDILKTVLPIDSAAFCCFCPCPLTGITYTTLQYLIRGGIGVLQIKVSILNFLGGTLYVSLPTFQIFAVILLADASVSR
jgi:hypothetical protein